MKVFTVIFLFMCSTQLAFSVTDRWTELMKLINQEMRLLEKAKRKGVEIKYRMLELFSEKLKLLHEKNNKDFLTNSSRGQSKDKEIFFRETRAFYQITKEFGQKILKEEVKNNRKAEILFALALNSRDYGRDQLTEKYLLEVIQLVKDSSNSIRHHAETAIADFYYNEKRYSDAIRFYQSVIRNPEDDWMTKHLFNLSWCYLKNRQFDEAIATIRKSYFESKNPQFINMRDQVLENIGSFYVYAGNPLEGLAFYLKNEKNPLPYLFPMAIKTSEKGHEKETKAILDASQEFILKNILYQHQEEIFHAYLDFYRHYNRFQDHEETVEKMVHYYLQKGMEKNAPRKELLGDAIEKLRTTAGFLQVKLSKDVKKGEAQFSHVELQLLLKYFNHLIAIDLKRKAEYLYFRAETYFSINSSHEAAENYVAAVKEANGIQDKELARKSLNSLLALTADEIITKGKNTIYLIFAYQQHIDLWPRDEKSLQIYPKLFEIHLENNEDERSANVIKHFNSAYPEHLKEQQAQMTKLLDSLIDKKSTEKINEWIMTFKKGFLSFPKETIEKTEIVLGNLLFMQYQDLAKKGDLLEAAEGFRSLYNHKLYPNKVKSEAAFFASMAYLEAGDTKRSFEWQGIASDLMTEEEKFKRREELLKMSERIYKLQDFSTSSKLANSLLKKFCSCRDDVQNRFFEVAIMTALVDERPDEAEKIVKESSDCLKQSGFRHQALSQIYEFHEKQGDFFKLRLFVKRHSSKDFKARYLSSLQKWYWERSDLNLKTHIRNEFRDLKMPETLTWNEEINKFEAAQKEAEIIRTALIWAHVNFDAVAFNRSVENYLLTVKRFKEKYQGLIASTQVDLSLLSARLFSDVFLDVGERISSLNPSGLGPEVLKEVRGAMLNVAKPILLSSEQYRKNLEKALISKENLIWSARAVASVEGIENPVFSFFTGLTMDRGEE